MAASRFEQLKEKWKGIQKYVVKKMESPLIQNISSVAGGVGVASGSYYFFGLFVSGGGLWALTVFSGLGGIAYAKYKLYKRHDDSLKLDMIVPIQVAVVKTAEHIIDLRHTDNVHEHKHQDHFIKQLRIENALRILANEARPEVRFQALRALDPPEDKPGELEGVLVQQLIDQDARMFPDEKWIAGQRLFPIVSVRDVVIPKDEDENESENLSTEMSLLVSKNGNALG